ncbi:uncharacterized protein BX663DRAFT_509784 [Cokeromyces recurvatus]|uniref:uncharacterized protein n=1 Tax=Cokeromyces recurvatus TaxID=90255 RepID=UPI002220829E|nr:uncharacterized protein BX663DRAFT_509784 [Cokeromyces recurvatus]KAI7902597.1 hypothetical protein BX663DRAFT_509784 [Cokeromyces recurvatus]
MELPQVGKHCQLSDCNSLDFLPIACPFCKQTFCGDHRLPLSHQCLQWNQVNNQLAQCNVCQHLIKAPESMNPEQALEKHKISYCQLYLYSNDTSMKKMINRDCAVDGCHAIDPYIGPVHCNGCEQEFCLAHRYPSSHHCVSLNENEQKKQDRKLAAQEKLSKTFHHNKPLVESSLKIKKAIVSKKPGGIVELMKMKSQAKGIEGSSIPIHSRIYLYVSSKDSTRPVFLNKKTSIGKALDLIADVCNINNKNNTLPSSDPERLELYKYPEMVKLDKSDILENVLQNLDTVLLERQGNIVTTHTC